MTSVLPQQPLVIGCNKGISPASPTIEQADLIIDSNDVRGVRGQRSTFVRQYLPTLMSNIIAHACAAPSTCNAKSKQVEVKVAAG